MMMTMVVMVVVVTTTMATMMIILFFFFTSRENGITRKTSGKTRSKSSQLAEPLWTDPSLKSGISLRELISTLKKF